MKDNKDSDLRKLYKASFRSALAKAKAMGIVKGRKKFIEDNTITLIMIVKKILN